jgi:predicted transcriptional regulator
MANTVPIAARIDIGLSRNLEYLAAATGRRKSWLISRALRFYIANERQFLAAVEEAKQAAREGRVLGHDAVAAASKRIVNSRR